MLCQAQGDYSSLLEAVYANANFCVYKLADEGADVNERTAEGDTLFHVAIKGGRSGSAHSLLIKGADVNARDSKGWAPLHYAAKLGQIGLMRDMFRPPSDQLVVIDLQTPSGESTLHLAALVGDNSVGWFLVEQGADLELVDANGRTALHYGVLRIIALSLRDC